MTLGFDETLYMLPFDQRESFQTKIFGWKGRLSAERTNEIAAAKQLVYEGFLTAIDRGAPAEPAAILVDEQFGAAILKDAQQRGFMTACPAEKSGQKEFVFEYGEDFARHIESVAPTFCKVLVRYNPRRHSWLNRRQSARLRRLSRYLRRTERKFMLELLVPSEAVADLAHAIGRFDLSERPRLTVDAMIDLQNADVEPDVWKVEAFDRHDDYARVVAAAQRDGRNRVSCIVLGGGAPSDQVETWLATAAGVPGFTGFAIGRTTFWDVLIDWRAGHLSRQSATIEIARRYRQWVDIFEHARSTAV